DSAAARESVEFQGAADSLERPGVSRVEGRLAHQVGSGLLFLPSAAGGSSPVVLEPGSVVTFHGPKPGPSLIPPLFQISVGRCARISGMLRGISEHAVRLTVPWQAAEIEVARPGVQAVIQRPGEARIFTDGFSRIDPSRWKVGGKPE